MIEALTLLAMTVFVVLAHLERRWNAEERARLTKAALAVNPVQAAAALDAAPKPAEPAPERRPTPIGL